MGETVKIQARARRIPKDAPRASAGGRTGRTPAALDGDRPSGSRITTNQSVAAASGILRPADLLRLHRTVGNSAISRMITAQPADRRTPHPPIQRRVILQQQDGSDTPIEKVEMLRNWLARFSITLERQPLRLLKLYAMHEAEGVFTYPWHLAGGDDARQFLRDLDGIVPFPGAEFTVPWLDQQGYAFFEQMHREAPRAFVSEDRFRYIIEKFLHGALSSQLLTAASEQDAIQAPTPVNFQRFRWICENLSQDLLAQQLTAENLTLLMALQKKLAIAPTAGLVTLVTHCGADNARRGLLYACLDARMAVDELSSGVLDQLAPFAGQLIGQPEVLKRAYGVATTEPDQLAATAPFSFISQSHLKATAYAKQQAADYRKTEMEALEESAGAEQAKALAAVEGLAKTKLSGKHKKGLGKPANGKDYQNALKALEAQKENLAANRLAEIKSNRLKRESEISDETESREKEALGAYRDYLNDPLVNHHPLAIRALELVQLDFGLARKLMGAIGQKPILGQLVTQAELSIPEIEICLASFSPADLASLLEMLTQNELGAFIAKAGRLAVLIELSRAGVNGAILKECASQTPSLDPYCTAAAAPGIAELITVHHYAVEEVIKTLNATSSKAGAPPARVGLVASIAQHARSPADLRRFLQVAERAGWDGAKIAAALGGLGNALPAAALCDTIYEGLLANLGPGATLRQWLDALEVPVADGWASITRLEQIDLGIGASGSRTLETVCIVERKRDGQELLRFVIHRHPGAKESTDNPMGSKKHVKPTPWSDERLPFNQSLGKAIYLALGGS